MSFEEMIAGLARPEAHPGRPGDVRVVHTHLSVVFVAGDRAFKIKKPVDLGFVDFTDPRARRQACLDEVKLNTRLAPGIYLGVVPVTRSDGTWRFGPGGETVDHAVEMKRLPEERTLAALADRGELAEGHLRRLADLVSEFYRTADSGPRVEKHGTWEAIAANQRENVQGLEPFIGVALAAEVHARLVDLTESALSAKRTLVEERARRRMTRDGHGDLRLEHVYDLPGSEPPLVVVDCIEFAERYRCQDPMADVAFIVMNLELRRRKDLARSFVAAWREATWDDEGLPLLPMYVAYRHLVRAKVRAMAASDREIGEEQRALSLARSRAHVLLALASLAEPAARPCVVIVSGLPGTGKSTLARGLEASAGFVRLSSDEVRKELAGIAPTTPAASAFGEGIYSPEWTERTYEELIRRTGYALLEGLRVAVDASFGRDAERLAFVDLAEGLGVPVVILECALDPALAESRIAARRGDPSDADAAIRAELARRREPASERVAPLLRVVDPSDADRALQAATAALADAGLA